MYRIPDTDCVKCGGSTSIYFVKSTGMDIKPTGMFRTCNRCGYKERIESLEEKNNQVDAKFRN